MDFDLEIISEEGDCPDPLFDSIMNAMNSMKEATADKIYQKIQKEGETNYSKPQVDRALASALKYGIFEVKNNRYRVRDDILDDEDTVYWKLQKKREQTPFRIQDNFTDRAFGPKLDPEKDNLRFRKVPTSESPECPQCGRTKRPAEDHTFTENKNKNHRNFKKKPRTKEQAQKLENESDDEEEEDEEEDDDDDNDDNDNDDDDDDDENNENDKWKVNSKRKKRSDSSSPERRKKAKTHQAALLADQKYILDDPFDRADNVKIEQTMARDTEKYISDSEKDSLSSPSDDEQSIISCPENHTSKYRRYNKPYGYSPECDDVERPDKMIVQAKRSSTSLKTESESDRSEESSGSDEQNQSAAQDTFFENLPCSSRNAGGKDTGRNQYLSPPEMYTKQYGKGQSDQCERKSEWMGGCADEPQGTIIQSNNVLTIEPMDSLAFKSPEQASYIS